ncbi:diacylglycerol/lipid kinase family protein [Brumimicrobium aurantiacum]|uniref:Diacylglycerol kinase family lipid kinase n=1 Tax=Brumimicrobium aurantiacum TaxID=1737063 RepID=A0A3E1EZX0_9FLAO|nr:diacylglycerol kinase family protein [Brumimicrobium aurantiacum]RFC55119.1 diacylglycerol kinase family lipid kinase [Brumimicrobium aurantiacum]
MKKSIHFIINPISGIGEKNILPSLIQKHLDHSIFTYKILFTEHRGHARLLSKTAAEEGVDIVCVAGGDGSVNEAGTALINSSTSLAILPTGSGNGIARHLGLSLKLKRSIQRLNTFKLKHIDTVTLNQKKAIGVSGFGFDALIAKRFDEYHSRGFLSYIKLVLKEFRNYKGISVILNEKEEFSDLLFCSVANTSQFGNGFYISPNSELEDGQFEVVIVKMPQTFAFIGLLIASLRGQIHHSKYVEFYKTSEMQIRIKNSMGHIDGEPVNFKNLNINLKCNPSSLTVVT